MQSGDIVIYKDEVGTVVTDYDNRDIMRFLPCNYGTYSTSRLKAITENDVREATHEEKLDLIRREYHWGKVVKIHLWALLDKCSGWESYILFYEWDS